MIPIACKLQIFPYTCVYYSTLQQVIQLLTQVWNEAEDKLMSITILFYTCCDITAGQTLVQLRCILAMALHAQLPKTCPDISFLSALHKKC